MGLSPQHVKVIEMKFSPAERTQVIAELSRITTDHTWQSQYNRDNAIGAILALSTGNMKQLRKLVDATLVDFRDVIYWSMLAREQSSDESII